MQQHAETIEGLQSDFDKLREHVSDEHEATRKEVGDLKIKVDNLDKNMNAKFEKVLELLGAAKDNVSS